MATAQEEQRAVSQVENSSGISARHAEGRPYRATFFVGFAGWTLDAFDFFLVVFLLTTIGREFHQPDAIAVGMLNSSRPPRNNLQRKRRA